MPRLLMQVAKAMVDGLSSGQFIPRAADSSSGFLINSCLTPCSPRPYMLLLDMLLAPLYVLLHRLVKSQIEAKTLAILAPRPNQRAATAQQAKGRQHRTAWLFASAIAVLAFACMHLFSR